MKKVLVVLSLFVAMTFVSVSAQAQQKTNVGQIVSGLINVNVGAINVQLIDLVDVSNVLNNNDVRILNNVLNNNTVLSNNRDILTKFLNDNNVNLLNSVVVGILSGPNGATTILTQPR